MKFQYASLSFGSGIMASVVPQAHQDLTALEKASEMLMHTPPMNPRSIQDDALKNISFDIQQGDKPSCQSFFDNVGYCRFAQKCFFHKKNSKQENWGTNICGNSCSHMKANFQNNACDSRSLQSYTVNGDDYLCSYKGTKGCVVVNEVPEVLPPAPPSSGDSVPAPPSSGESVPAPPSSGDSVPAPPSSGDSVPAPPSSGDSIPAPPKKPEVNWDIRLLEATSEGCVENVNYKIEGDTISVKGEGDAGCYGNFGIYGQTAENSRVYQSYPGGSFKLDPSLAAGASFMTKFGYGGEGLLRKVTGVSVGSSDGSNYNCVVDQTYGYSMNEDLSWHFWVNNKECAGAEFSVTFTSPPYLYCGSEGASWTECKIDVVESCDCGGYCGYGCLVNEPFVEPEYVESG